MSTLIALKKPLGLDIAMRVGTTFAANIAIGLTGFFQGFATLLFSAEVFHELRDAESLPKMNFIFC